MTSYKIPAAEIVEKYLVDHQICDQLNGFMSLEMAPAGVPTARRVKNFVTRRNVL